jgi:decaprenyl-phosphate phosphoribosyltransferase
VGRIKIAEYVRLARPKQWIKNLLVFAVPLASRDIFRPEIIIRTFVAFIAFTLASASVYIWNDIRDAPSDRLNPVKASRPLARGAVNPRPVAVLAFLLLMSSIGISFFVNEGKLLVIILSYLVIQVAYQLKLREFALLDMSAVASGFVLRAIAGGFASDIPISVWFLSVTASTAFMIVSAKRHSEFVSEKSNFKTRLVLNEYTEPYLRFLWSGSLLASLIFYSMWSAGIWTAALDGFSRLSVIPFILVLLRYAIFADRGQAESPEKIIWSDRQIQIYASLWILVFLL